MGVVLSVPACAAAAVLKGFKFFGMYPGNDGIRRCFGGNDSTKWSERTKTDCPTIRGKDNLAYVYSTEPTARATVSFACTEIPCEEENSTSMDADGDGVPDQVCLGGNSVVSNDGGRTQWVISWSRVGNKVRLSSTCQIITNNYKHAGHQRTGNLAVSNTAGTFGGASNCPFGSTVFGSKCRPVFPPWKSTLFDYALATPRKFEFKGFSHCNAAGDYNAEPGIKFNGRLSDCMHYCTSTDVACEAFVHVDGKCRFYSYLANCEKEAVEDPKAVMYVKRTGLVLVDGDDPLRIDTGFGISSC